MDARTTPATNEAGDAQATWRRVPRLQASLTQDRTASLGSSGPNLEENSQ
jgi:hypothetical protein